MPSKNIPVNGWPQIKDLDIAAPILAELDKIETWQKSVKQETKSGAYVEFTNALALDASSVIAEITASQDLHGYDKPWVGGSRKNLLGDSDYETNATGSTNHLCTHFSKPTAGDKITLSAYADGVALNADHCAFSFKAGDTTIISFAPGQTRTSPDMSALTGVNIYTDSTLANKNVIAQLEIGESVTAYEPYENICPISGYSSVVITDVDAESHTATVTVALGSTVYGGTLDLTSGELTITHALFTVSNDGNWSVMSTNVYQHTRLDGAKTGVTTYTDAISSCFNEQRTGVSSMTNGGFKIQDGFLYVKSTDYDTATDFATAFAGQTVLYELATPTTTTLTAAQLALVKGYNYLTCNSGNITVTAYTGNTWN